MHQAFEGFALGGIIATSVTRSAHRLALVLVFCLTTPVGIAVGLGVENYYSEDSRDNKIARRVLNAFATGNLLVGRADTGGLTFGPWAFPALCAAVCAAVWNEPQC